MIEIYLKLDWVVKWDDHLQGNYALFISYSISLNTAT